MYESKVKSELKILDFDLETIAAGFADPEWVPQKITCAAWSWIGEKEVRVEICTPLGLFGKPELRVKMLKPLVEAINEADMLTGHNLIRFDLPVLQSELLRLGLSPLGPQLVQDTIRIVKTKGFKKGQDNLGALLKSKQQKLSLSWQNWEDAYDEKDWPTIKERASKDVIQHKEVREEMIKDKWLRKPIMWHPGR
jgi:DNA polymerase elongation subunit (family B)